jgi:hypothetical protein
MSKKKPQADPPTPPKQPRITVDEDLHAVLVAKSAGRKRNYYSRLANRLLRKAMVETNMISDDLTGPPESEDD